jgi:hypothetical protein
MMTFLELTAPYTTHDIGPSIRKRESSVSAPAGTKQQKILGLVSMRGRYAPFDPVVYGTNVSCPNQLTDRHISSAVVGHNDDLMAEVCALWVKPDDIVLDVTYGNGSFWKKLEEPTMSHDIAIDGVDFRDLPEDNDSVDVGVFDPPYRPSHGSTASYGYEARYGIIQSINTINDVLNLYESGILSLHRVIKPGGRILVKCQDMSYSNRLHLVTLDVMRLMINAGFDVADQFVLVSGTGPARTDHSQHRAKRSHSILWVGVSQ